MELPGPCGAVKLGSDYWGYGSRLDKTRDANSSVLEGVLLLFSASWMPTTVWRYGPNLPNVTDQTGQQLAHSVPMKTITTNDNNRNPLAIHCEIFAMHTTFDFVAMMNSAPSTNEVKTREATSTRCLFGCSLDVTPVSWPWSRRVAGSQTTKTVANLTEAKRYHRG